MKRDFRQIPAFVNGLFNDVRDVLYETAVRVKDRLSVEGKPVKYPIDWDTPKQKRTVLWKLRKAGEIPYRRKGLMRLGMKVERVPLGTRLKLPSPAGAVLGLPSGWQSRIFRGRWPHLLTVLFDELAKIPNEISNRFTVTAGKL
jgi:hypothetical protein